MIKITESTLNESGSFTKLNKNEVSTEFHEGLFKLFKTSQIHSFEDHSVGGRGKLGRRLHSVPWRKARSYNIDGEKVLFIDDRNSPIRIAYAPDKGVGMFYVASADVKSILRDVN